MKNLLLILFSLFLFALPSDAKFSDAKFSLSQHYTVGNGLSNNFVHGIVQDAQGRIWIATESGLNCYDGYHFMCFKSYNSKLRSNYVNTLYRDERHHKIWIGVKGLGVYVIDEDTGEISDVTPHDISICNVMSISSSSDDGVWLVSNNKIIHYSYQQAKFTLFLSSKKKEAYRMAIDDGVGHLVVVNYYEGIRVLNIKNKKQVLNDASLKNINKEYVYKLDMDEKRQLWIATNYGLRVFDIKTYQITSVNEIGTNPVYEIKQYGKYKLVATNSALKTIDPVSMRVIYSMDIKNVWRIYVDNFKNLWLGTNSDGIYFLGTTNNPFRNVLPKSVWCLTQDDNKLWIGGYNAVYLIENNQLVREYPILYNGFNGNVLSIQDVDENHLIFAVYGRLLSLNKQTGKVVEMLCEGKVVSAVTFYRDANHIIWITANNGIYSLSNDVVRYERKLNRVLANQVTNAIRLDADGKLWIGTIEHGLYVFDKSHNLVKHFTQSKSFFSNTIMHMRLGAENRLWLATSEGIGLFRNTLNSYEVEHFDYKQGLNDPFIRTMREDKWGNVWVSTNNGLSYLNMKTRFFSNFNQNDGLPSNNITGGMYVSPNGTAYITSLDGLITFNANQLVRKRKPSSIRFVRCTVLNATVEQMSEQILKAGKDQICHLRYNQNDIRVAFAVTNKAQSKQVDYSYKVDNLVEEWTMTDENVITFRSLSPGKYTIRVRARLHGQSWDSSTSTAMTVIIAQPWWWTITARCIYLCILMLAIYLYFHRYKHHLQIKNALELERRKNIVEQEYYQERLQFFTNIAHELRTPLTLIFGPLEELLQSDSVQKNDLYNVNIIQKNAQRLMELINRLMEFRKAETHNLQLVVSKGNLKQTVKEIACTFKDANQQPAVSYIIDIEETTPYIYYDKNVIKSILSNLLNNACKYTQKGSIGISLSQVIRNNHQYSCLKVWDTGCGIEKEALPHIFDRYYQVNGAHQASGTGIGLALVKSLCQKHKILLDVTSKVGVGTAFTLLIDNEEIYQDALHQEGVDSQGNGHEEYEVQNEISGQQSHGTQPTILVVEDNREINNYMAHSLRKDYHILQAGNGEEGLRLAKEMMPEIIICDIMMPVMDGFAMLQQLRADIATCHIPVIMLTAKTTIEDQQRCYELGVNSFMTKPFSVKMLKARVNNLLETQKNEADYILRTMKSEKKFTEEENARNKLSILDQKFLDKINQIIKEHIASEKLTLTMLADQLGVSQSTLYRKMKALTGVSGNEYIRKMRLTHSLQLMQEAGKNISEAAYESGFVDLAYFRACFKEEFGVVPSDYLKKER